MKNAVSFLVVIAMVLLITPCYATLPTPPPAPPGFVLYDNFNGKLIDPDKWVGQEYEKETAHRVLRESEREITCNQLHLESRAWACTSCEDEGSMWGQNRLRALGPLIDATAIQVTVHVNKLSLMGSDENTAPARVTARLLGYFFNDGQSQGSNDLNGDVAAYIGIQRQSNSPDPANMLVAFGGAFKCTNVDCTTSTPLGWVPLGPVRMGCRTTLYLEWNAEDDSFIFKAKPNFFTEYYGEINYGETKEIPSDAGNKRLEVMCEVPNDTTGTRPTAAIDAYFDNVYYLPGLLPVLEE